MTSPRVRGKKVAASSTKIKKETDGIKGDYEKPGNVESTLKMMIRQAHEIHKGFYKRTQGLRKSQSFEDLKNKTQDLPRISDGKGDAGKENIPNKKLKDPVKLGKIVRAPLHPKVANKKIRRNAEEAKIRKLTSAASECGTNSSKKNIDEGFEEAKKDSQKDVKVLYENELKSEDDSGKKFGRVLSPEEVLLKTSDKTLENFSKTNARFIEVLKEIGEKVLKDEVKAKKPKIPLKKRQGGKSSPNGVEEIRRDDAPKEEVAIDRDKELKSYRELRSFVNDELIRIWKPYQKVEVELEKPEVEELKPGRIIVKPNPTSYLEKRALSPKSNFTSFIRKLDQEKKNVTEDEKIVNRLEKAFETLNGINWENPMRKLAKIKEEDLAKSILQRIDDHKKVIVGEISKTEREMNEKFGVRKKLKTKVEGDKALEIHFKRSLEEVQSADGLLLETEKECKEITRKIFDEYRSKKFGNKLTTIDRKIQKDLKKLGLINFNKTDRIKLRDKGPEKVAECSGWRRKKSQPSRSISRSIGSAGGTDQGLPPISLQDEPTIPAKLIANAKPVDTGTGFAQGKLFETVDKAEDTDDICDQVLETDSGWDETLEDPGGSDTKEPVFVDLEELKYRKGDPSFRCYGKRDEESCKENVLTREEIEALRRKRELQKILELDKDFATDEDREKKLTRKSKESKEGKGASGRMSIIVNHITSGERIDDNEKVLGHASKLVVKQDKEIREKKKLAQCYYKQGMRRVTEPAISQSPISEIDVLKRTTRKSEPINIKRTESKDAECQTDTTDTSDDDMDLYSLGDESIN